MKMLEIAALPNGAHRNQTFHGSLPDGWAVIPDDMEIPATFPFVNIKVEEITHYRDVPATREVPNYDNFDGAFLGNITEEYTVQEPYGVMTVTSMTEGVMPEVKPVEPMPTQLDIIEAQVTYTAMMTDTLLEV